MEKKIDRFKFFKCVSEFDNFIIFYFIFIFLK